MISFRLTEEQYAQIEKAAVEMGEGANSWCRRMIIAQGRGGSGLTKTERLLHKDIDRVRYLMEATFGMLFGSDEVTDASKKMGEINKQPETIADDLFSF